MMYGTINIKYGTINVVALDTWAGMTEVYFSQLLS